jgi:hypothetical protein
MFGKASRDGNQAIGHRMIARNAMRTLAVHDSMRPLPSWSQQERQACPTLARFQVLLIVLGTGLLIGAERERRIAPLRHTIGRRLVHLHHCGPRRRNRDDMWRVAAAGMFHQHAVQADADADAGAWNMGSACALGPGLCLFLGTIWLAARLCGPWLG